MLTKKCKQCGIELSIEMFYKHKDCKDGVVGACKECYRKNKKQYREENKEYLREKDKQKYQRGRNSILKRVNEYRKTHKEQVIIAHKEWYEKNKERHQLNGKLYVEQNREKVRQYKKQYAEQNKDKIRKRERHRYLENKEKRINDSKIWKKANPEKVSVSSQKRRALQKELPSTLNAEQWTTAKECFNNKCAYCGKETGLTQDHFLPLSKSGEYSVSNIIPACLSCNSSKNDSDFFEWYSRQPFYSKKRERKILKYLNYDAKTRYQQIAI